MAILLSSANDSVIQRWVDLLKDKYDLNQADSVDKLKSLCMDEEFDLILLHRPLVDPGAFVEIDRLSRSSGIFLFSDKPDEEEGLAFLKLGIVGYANTYISAERLTEAVQVVRDGAIWLGQSIMQRLIRDAYTRASDEATSNSDGQLESLTKREHEIAGLIAQGQTNLEIAANLDISERTVKAHLSSVYEKTKTGNRLNLALLVNQGRRL
jgi:two-component system nitrate/nitrite response regulator NarL